MAKQAVNREAAQAYQQMKKERKNMELQVEDLELKARYWKAQFDIRHYTLEAEKLQVPYDEYMTEQRKKSEELQKKFEEQLKELQAKGAEVVEDGKV